MSTEDIRWLIGLAVTIAIAITGTAIGIFRSLSGKIETGESELRKDMKDGHGALHERVNRVRDEYVRRVDLDDRMRHFQETLQEMKADLKVIRDRGARQN